MKMELRVNPSAIEANSDGSLTVRGYVNKTNQYSELLGRTEQFREKIAPGAFTKAVQRAKEIHFLAEHDNSKILSSTRNNSLKLQEDNNGLYMEATICPTTWGKDYYQLIQSGILSNMSFGFKAVQDEWRKAQDGVFERTVNDLDLFEVSVVRDPAYSQSTVSARGIDVVEDVIPDEIKEEQRSEDNQSDAELRMVVDVEAIANSVMSKLMDYMNANNMVARSDVADGDDDEVADEPEAIDGGSGENPDEIPVQAEPEQPGDDESGDPDDDDPEEETLVQPAEEEKELTRAKEIKEFIKRFR